MNTTDMVDHLENLARYGSAEQGSALASLGVAVTVEDGKVMFSAQDAADLSPAQRFAALCILFGDGDAPAAVLELRTRIAGPR
ncbi:hypothetical protein [Devosia nitrariae]|uniref:Uncharacterized protein n=1 Tax=Devosia nitrariae TaxID=2071872 RepID=A0ABQ5W130_9HYPH|nr:hypothetical protein [Devosia nitrariae]GLQ53584.1 hypothetical protein GCM10010862_08430 [Devosia nitrariae]